MCALIVDKEEKRDTIMMAALKVFAEKGLSQTTIRDIADKAGIGKGTVYEYFRNKDEIIHNSFFYFQKIFDFDVSKILLSEGTGMEKLKNLIRVFANAGQSDNAEYLELMFEFWAQGMKGHAKGLMLAEMKKFYTGYRKVFAEIISEGIMDGSIRTDAGPSALASILVGMLDGIMVQWIIDKESINMEAIKKNLEEVVAKGIATKI